MKITVKKTVTAAMLVALTVSLSSFAIPIGASKCYPVQHLVNVVCAVFLGPGYGVMAAFCTSFIRNLLGTGSLLAFPGSMVGAFLCGIVYQKTHKLILTYIGEVIGTGLIGGMLCFPVAASSYGKGSGVIYLCHAVFHEHGLRHYHGGDPRGRSGKGPCRPVFKRCFGELG